MNYTLESIKRMKAKAVADYKSTRRVVKALKKLKPQPIDKFFLERHEHEFSQIDCLECANCCKSISPAMYEADVRRMAANTRMKVQDFIEKYLFLDEEGEYVFKTSPCPFLGNDNYCAIYSSRPKACREYPHTNRKRIHQILDLTARNSKLCPVVHNIVERLKEGSGPR